jgi:hypothetical protein
MYASVFCEPWTCAAKDAEVVQLFDVSRASIKRYLKQRREEGHVRPKAIPGRPPAIRAQVEADVLPQLQAHDDASASATQCHVGANARRTREKLSDEPGDEKTWLDAKKVARGDRARALEARAGRPRERGPALLGWRPPVASSCSKRRFMPHERMPSVNAS